MTKSICFSLIIVFVAFSGNVHAAAPMQTVERHINQLLDVLKDQTLVGTDGTEKKKEAVRTISDSLFDFYTVSRRTLGAHWKKLTPQQREQFILLYRKLLESVYMDRLLQYKDEKVKYIKEVALSETRAEVHSAIVIDSGEIPFSYKMFLKKGNWKVYDILVENVSLVGNYRTQFNDLFAKNSPGKVLDIMRQRVEGYTQPEAQ